MDARQLEALNAFIARIEELDIVFNDSNPENVLLDETGDELRFIMVDGFGDQNLLQLRRLSRRFRKSARARRWRRMADFLDLDWNAETERLERR